MKKQDEINIVKLEFPDNVRLRSGMYVGDIDQPAVILREVVDNGIDELLGNHADKIDIVCPDRGELFVIDNGRGVPVQPDENGNTTAISVWGSLHASSKFSDTEISIGLNGVGASCTNALSEYFVGYVNLTKKFEQGNSTLTPEVASMCRVHEKDVDIVYRVEFQRGLLISESVIPYEVMVAECKMENLAEWSDFGTAVRFLPDATIWKTIDVTYDFTNLSILMTTIDPKTQIRFNGERVEPYDLRKKFNKTEFISVKEGDGGYLANMKVDIPDDIVGQGSTEDSKLLVNFDITFGFAGTDFDEQYDGSVNTLHTPEGLHIRMAKQALGRAMAELHPALNPSDIRYGIRIMPIVFTNRAQFASQTKEKLSDVQGMQQKAVLDYLQQAFVKKIKKDKQLKQYLNFVVDRILDYKRTLGDLSVRQLVHSSIKKSDESRTSKSLGVGVYEASSKKRGECELFVVEGKSAAGNLVQARNPKFHAILPLTLVA